MAKKDDMDEEEKQEMLRDLTFRRKANPYASQVVTSLDNIREMVETADYEAISVELENIRRQTPSLISLRQQFYGGINNG